jgi:hypothetical protein
VSRQIDLEKLGYGWCPPGVFNTRIRFSRRSGSWRNKTAAAEPSYRRSDPGNSAEINRSLVPASEHEIATSEFQDSKKRLAGLKSRQKMNTIHTGEDPS